MECISCRSEARLSLWKRLLLCESCRALAEKADKEIDQRFAIAREGASKWLEEHIIEGKLLRGGSGIDIKVTK